MTGRPVAKTESDPDHLICMSNPIKVNGIRQAGFGLLFPTHLIAQALIQQNL